LKLHRADITVSTEGKGFTDITERVRREVAAAKVREGLVSVFVMHTSASLVIQENADPSVRRDLERFFSRIVPEDALYEHDAEGPDDMPSHIRSALTRTSETIPIRNGELAVGTWQGLYLWEHRNVRHERCLCVTVFGT
jgi:secondary thiamine-phosphate synthase enzyme